MSTYLLCKDEDLATYAASDLDLLIPDGQWYARGNDGYFGAGNPWLMASSAVDFLAQSVASGMFVRLENERRGETRMSDRLLVDSVSSAGVTLRRWGSVASPPVPAGGATGIAFEIGSLAVQCEQSSYSIAERLGLNPAYGTNPSRLVDPRQLREVTCYDVLHLQYLAQAYAAGNQKDAFVAKSIMFQKRRDAVMDSVMLRTKESTPGVALPPQTGRLVR